MLVFVSDIHMSDGTAGIANLPKAAFTGTLHDIAGHARNAGAADVTVVFLGDLFDMIRTEVWFDPDAYRKQDPLRNPPAPTVDPDEKPWGSNPTEGAAATVLNRILEVNRDAFEALGGDWTEHGFATNPRRVYIAGNHDRVCNLYPSLRQLVCEALGITGHDPAEPFEWQFADADHAAFARHGHVWDPYNFEGSAAFRQKEWTPIPQADYAQTPIGDVIACEVFSKLPGAVVARLPAGHPSASLLRDRLRDLFDVRPITAVPAWLAYQVHAFHDAAVTHAVNAGVKQVAREFAALPFVQAWYRRHDSWINPFDRADQLQYVMKLMEAFDLSTVEMALPHLHRLMSLLPSDNHASKAAEDFTRLDSAASPWPERMRYVLYGHTHQPEQRAIAVTGAPPSEVERVYLNTGAWRPAWDQGVTSGFVRWSTLTYTIVYRPDERASSSQKAPFPAFEAWTGALKSA